MTTPLSFIRGGACGCRLVLILALAVPAAVFGARGDSVPRLLSTGESAPKWKNFDELKKQAADGDPEACLALGTAYETGGEVEQDHVEARLWYERAARAGLIEADFRLGRFLSEGLGGSVDQAAAFGHYLKAAQGGIALAQYNVGAMLASGRGTTRNYPEGLAWIIVATRDPSVDPAGEQQLREHLARRPSDIAAAERRAAELQKEIEERRAAAEAEKQAKSAPARRGR